MKKLILTLIATVWALCSYAEDITLLSPEGHIKVTVAIDEDVTWSVSID